MSKVLLLLMLASFLLLNPIFSQQEKPPFPKNQVGIQLNPYLDKDLFNGLMHPIVGIRYGYKIIKPVMVGAEVSGSCSYFFQHTEHIPAYNIRAGLFTKYSIPSAKRLQGFVEVSPYISHTYYIHASYDDDSGLGINKFGVYIAPGISLYSKNKKFSFDLYYKFSNLKNFNGHKSMISYKFNFNF